MLRCLSYLRITMSFLMSKLLESIKWNLNFCYSCVFNRRNISCKLAIEPRIPEKKNRISKWAISYLCVEYQQSAMVTGKQTDFRNVYLDNNLMKGVLNVGGVVVFILST